MKFLSNHKLLLIGAFIGAGLGYAYYYFVGCKSGTCLITGRPVNSSLYGALMGMLTINLFGRDKNQNRNKSE